MVLFISRKEVILMQVPSLKDAHKRTKNDILVKTSDYKVPDDLKKNWCW